VESMSDVTQALQSDNGWIIAILIVIIVVLVIIGARNGLIKIKTNKVQVGLDADAIKETAHQIITHQKDWVKIAVSAFNNKIPEPDEYNKFRGMFILEKCLNEIDDWITLNHIEDKKNYIKLKQELMWNLILSYTEKEELQSDAFKKEVYDYVEYIIKNLVRIRKQYDTIE
jgi:hypothetical protein